MLLKPTPHATNSLVQNSSQEDNSFSRFEKFPAFYETWKSITVFTRAHHLSVSWASLIPSYLRPIVILSSVLYLRFFPWNSPTKSLYEHLLPHVPRALPMAIFLYHPNNIWCAAQIIRPLIMQFFPASCTSSLSGLLI